MDPKLARRMKLKRWAEKALAREDLSPAKRQAAEAVLMGVQLLSEPRQPPQASNPSSPASNPLPSASA